MNNKYVIDALEIYPVQEVAALIFTDVGVKPDVDQTSDLPRDPRLAARC
jgi:hypothetical protein